MYVCIVIIVAIIVMASIIAMMWYTAKNWEELVILLWIVYIVHIGMIISTQNICIDQKI